jgi:type II secretory pathway predicted ATPase ExeA
MDARALDDAEKKLRVLLAGQPELTNSARVTAESSDEEATVNRKVVILHHPPE